MRKQKRASVLWLYFVSTIFAIMLISAVSMSIIAIILYHMGWISPENEHPLIPILLMLFLSVITGTVISFTTGKKTISPVAALSRQLREVAAGNFEVQLDTTSRIPEVDDMIKNFNQMTKELSSIETLRNDFVTNVSHELKTPLSAIEGYATLLQDQQLPEAERDMYVQMIIDSSRQLSTLTGNILRLSKLENQEVIPDKKDFRLDEQIRMAVLMLEPEWNKKELNLEIDLQKIVYHSNEELLLQVWMNLISNAVKFTAPQGTITLQLFQNDADIVIQIKDTGKGMSKSEMDHIFDKFYQGDSSRKSDGNGLGLALVKRIVELCKGRIAVKSTPGTGTIFTIFLPGLSTI